MRRHLAVVALVVAAGNIGAPATASDSPELVAHPRNAVVENLAPGQTRSLLSTITNVSQIDAEMAITAVNDSAAAAELNPVQMTIDVCTTPWEIDASGEFQCVGAETRIVADWQVQGVASTASDLRIEAGGKVFLRTQVALTGDDAPSVIQGRSGSIAFAFSASQATPSTPTVAATAAAGLAVTGTSTWSGAAWTASLLATGAALLVAAHRHRNALGVTGMTTSKTRRRPTGAGA